MVQSFDYSVNRPNYNAVKINIKKPEVNAGDKKTSYADDNGIYNAVNIEIDNPTVNTEPKKVYDYPYAEELITCDMMNFNPCPVKFPVTYHTTNVILPKMENELEMGLEFPEPEEAEEVEEVVKNETPEIAPEEIQEETETIVAAENVEAGKNETIVTDNKAAVTEETKPEVPEPNYTTVEAEKGENEITFHGADDEAKVKADNNVQVKRPEIIPGEEITPEVDIPLVLSNLKSENYDVQAQQMEEIARISLDNPQNAVPYLVRDVFSSLIDISKKDTTNLAAPSDAQIDARKKLITNFILIENARQQNRKDIKLPYQITEADFALANELSPLEMAERNKEYALTTMAILTKVYTDEVERHTGNVVPFTDLPGSAAIVDALRYSPNAGVKIAAIDSLRYIQRKEYKDELSTLYSLAQADPNPQVAMSAARALELINRQQ